MNPTLPLPSRKSPGFIPRSRLPTRWDTGAWSTDGNPHDLAWEILDAHFGKARDRVPSREDWEAAHPELAAELRRREQHGDQLLALAEEVACS